MSFSYVCFFVLVFVTYMKEFSHVDLNTGFYATITTHTTIHEYNLPSRSTHEDSDVCIHFLQLVHRVNYRMRSLSNGRDQIPRDYRPVAVRSSSLLTDWV